MKIFNFEIEINSYCIKLFYIRILFRGDCTRKFGILIRMGKIGISIIIPKRKMYE